MAIVPADLVEAYERLVDQEAGAVAVQRLADLAAGHSSVVAAEDVVADLGA